MSFEEQLKKKMEEMKKNKQENSNSVIVSEKIFKVNKLTEDIENKFSIFNEETDEEILFLKQETLNLLNLQISDTLELGKIINNVYEKFASQGSKSGTYTKWLKIANINNKTAIRYRKKYLIFEKLEDKNQILFVNNKILDQMDILSITESLNKTGLISLPASTDEVIIDDFVSEKYVNLFSNFEKKINSLKIPEDVKNKVSKKIEEILSLLKEFE